MTGTNKWATFDCYGTLIDWQSGMRQAVESVAPGRVDELLAGYHRHEPAVQKDEPFPAYRAVLTRSLVLAAADAAVPLPDAASDVLARTLPSWPAFADTVPALEALKDDGWRLGVLSNVDDDLVAGTLEGLGVQFDEVVTAEQVRSYKPGLAHFEEFRRRAGAGAGRWTHVACSWRHDVEPCVRLGVPCVFINREGEVRDTSAAVAALPGLTGLAEVLQPRNEAQPKV
jgi:2-haloacid dehalogenase